MSGRAVKAAMSGTRICLVSPIVVPRGCVQLLNAARPYLSAPRVSSHGPRRWPLRINSIGGDRLGNLWFRHHPFVGQRLDRRDHHVMAVDLEELPQRHPVVAATETVGAEAHIALRHERPDLLGEGAHVIRRCNDRPLATVEAFLYVALARRLRWMKQIPPLGREAVSAQFVETRAAPDVGCDAEVVLQELRGGDDFAQDGAAPEKLDARR